MAARRRFLAFPWLLLASLLAACPAPPVAPSASPGPLVLRASRKPSAAPSTPAAAPSAPASAAVTPPLPSALVSLNLPSGGPSLAPAPTKLTKPAAAAIRTLAGVVRIDAAYAIQAGEARLIANNGGTAIGAPGLALLEGAGNLIANNGGGLVGNNGGTLISDHGAMLVGKSKRALLQAAPTAAPGAVLPAGGLVVAVMSLRSGRFVPIGQDGSGQPVYAILTNAQGGFEVYPPADAGPLLVVARFPLEASAGAAQADPRLAYDLIQGEATDAPPADLVLDEDTSQVTRYVRVACAGTLEKFVLTDDVEATVQNIAKDAAPGLKEPLTTLVRELRQASGEAGLDKAGPAVTAAVAQRMTDVLLSYMGIDSVTLSPINWPEWTGPEEPAIPALIDIMRRLREGTTKRLATEPGFFDAMDEVVEANALLSTDAPRWTIRKAADLNDFVVRAIVVPDRGAQRTEKVFAAVGVEAYQSDRLYAAVNNYIAAMALTALAQPDAKAAVIAEIRLPR